MKPALMVVSALMVLVFLMWLVGPVATDLGHKRGIKLAMYKQALAAEIKCRAEIYNRDGRVTDQQIQWCKDYAATYALQVLGGAGEQSN